MPNIFSRLFAGRVKPKEEEAVREKIEEKPREKKSEAEELEDAIRNLDLFRKVEKGRKIGEKYGLLKRVFRKDSEEKPVSKKMVFGKLFEREKKEAAGDKPAKKPIFESLFGKAREKTKENIAEDMLEEPKPARLHKSKKLEKFFKILDSANSALEKNDLKKSKNFYLEAREAYIKLEYNEKKEAYGDLTELYNKLSK